MNTHRLHVPMVILASAISALQSAALEPVRAACSIRRERTHRKVASAHRHRRSAAIKATAGQTLMRRPWIG